jgi:hydroxyethylthiazole kinase
MLALNQKAAENLIKIREQKPLIHNITNYVVMNFTANILLSMGASPVMAHAENEVEDMVGFSSALVINIGTLSDPWVSAMIKAGKKATSSKTPIVLDPVGSGATKYRTETAKKIIDETDISVIRGNASEILSLCNTTAKTKGVDSTHSVDETFEPALIMAKESDLTVAITGPTDLVTDGKRIIEVKNGHPLMANVTGTGCAVSAITGAFCSVDDDPVSAAATALAFFGVAGEIAAEKADAPGSFMIALIDALYTMTPEELEEKAKFITK